MNREDFPMLNQDYIYFDNGATTFKPNQVIQSVVDYYTKYTANSHRGDYDLSQKVDYLYENTRDVVKNFIKANNSKEIIFTSGTTMSLNMIVFGFMKYFLKPGDEVLITKAEHASNVLPWLELESLRLWVLINSTLTPLSFEEFKSLVFGAYNEVINNWDEEINKLLKLQDDYNTTKYIKVRYHYKKEDFNNITPDMTLTQAYNDWCKYEFPHFLEYYKNEELNKFKRHCIENGITGEYKTQKYDKLKNELERLKLPKPTKGAFLKLLNRYGIKYKQKKH